MEKKLFGDKLPGATISEEEWAKLKKYWVKQEKPLTMEAKVQLDKRFVRLKGIFCVGEKETTCWLCGGETTKVNHYGLCSVCRRAFVNRGTLRQSGTIRHFNHKNVLCAACEKTNACSLGVCRNCFYLMKQKGFSNHEELKDYYKKIEQASLGTPEVPAILTKIR